ncbi:MAG: GspE/PulE family protein [Motiliproteus sp.]|nr:GspE/PulE family protein [Motiliproteus sp.]MCW9053810.1 GspE/PulE family protein [Motiliproteus sp.]
MDKAAQVENPNSPSTDEFYEQLTALIRKLHEAKSFADAFEHLEPAMLELFQAERISVYQRNRTRREIFCRFKTGDELREIQLPITPKSLAGFVALSRKPLLISDVYNSEGLKKLHPQLGFDSSYDRKSGFKTQSVIVVPILHNKVLLGVIQIINRRDGGTFTSQDLKRARELAQFFAQKFRYDFDVMDNPFDYLIKTGVLEEQKLEQLQAISSREMPITRLLKRDAQLSSKQIGESLERYYQVPYQSYDPDQFHPHPLQQQINISYLRKQSVALLEGARGQVIVVIDDPNDSARLLEIQNALKGQESEICVGLEEEIQQYLGGNALMSGDSGNLDTIVGELDEIEDFSEDASAEDAVSEEAPTVVRMVNRILMDAKRLGASDIHIEPGKGKEPARVRMRIDGVCQEIIQIPASHVPATLSRIKIQSNLDISEKRKPQDGKFGIRIQGQLLEVRVATVPTVNNESVVMRLLATGEALRFNQLNLMPTTAERVEKILQRPHGVVLVVGPTGSGKTSTLHALLGRLNSPEKKIWTAEDPVEITQPGLQQVQVNPKIGFDFAAALRAFLRADPDIILIGEMRDRETAHIGIEASLTGHLVLSTLHTNSAPETVTRLLDLGIDPVNFSDACLGILAQRLVRTLCPKCKQRYTIDEEEAQFLRRQYDENLADELQLQPGKTALFKANGCEQCNMSGYKGRTGIHELLQVTPELRELIYDKATVPEIRVQAIKDGMRTLLQDGIQKIIKGDLDFTQLRQITYSDE